MLNISWRCNFDVLVLEDPPCQWRWCIDAGCNGPCFDDHATGPPPQFLWSMPTASLFQIGGIFLDLFIGTILIHLDLVAAVAESPGLGSGLSDDEIQMLTSALAPTPGAKISLDRQSWNQNAKLWIVDRNWKSLSQPCRGIRCNMM